MSVQHALDFSRIWKEGLPYWQFVSESEKNSALWDGVYRTARIPGWAIQLACQHAAQFRLLVIAENWCGDASNTVPVLAKLGDLADCLEMRVILRDQHPEVMDRYLTNGGRSIPIVVGLNEDFREVGHWGPRPSELQAWVLANKDRMPKSELYPRVRRWYARDRGETTLREVLALFAAKGSGTDEGVVSDG